MKLKHIITAAAALIISAALISPVQARRTSGAPTGNVNMNGVTMRVQGLLYKTSIKGSNKGWVSSASKSVEASLQDIGGEKVSFSASGAHYQALVDNAAQYVIVDLAPNKGAYKVEDGKSKMALVKITPLSDMEVDEEVICGPEDPGNIQHGKAYSVGFRVARAAQFVKGRKNAWKMVAYVGSEDDEVWNTKGADDDDPEVILSDGCTAAANTTKLLNTRGALAIFDYDQEKEGGTYYVKRIAILQ